MLHVLQCAVDSRKDCFALHSGDFGLSVKSLEYPVSFPGVFAYIAEVFVAQLACNCEFLA